MTADCMTIVYLRELAQREANGDKGLALAAESALHIVTDIRENYMTDTDVASLHMLVDDIRQSGHEILLDHLWYSAPDCAMCAALAARVAAQFRSGLRAAA
jgi:hypothetical protein